MRKLTLALIATVAAAGLTTAASAADLLIDQSPAPVVDNSYSGFDWNGAYAGISLSGQTGSIYGLGADLGVNALIDNNLLVGAEGNVTWLNDDSWQGQVHGKLGFASGNFAFYGLLGVGYNTESEAYAPDRCRRGTRPDRQHVAQGRVSVPVRLQRLVRRRTRRQGRAELALLNRSRPWSRRFLGPASRGPFFVSRRLRQNGHLKHLYQIDTIWAKRRSPRRIQSSILSRVLQ